MGQDLPPYKYKGPWPIEGDVSQMDLSITHLSFYLSFPLLFQPHILFLYYLRGMRGRPSWLAEPRTTKGAPAPMESLPGGRSLVSRQ
jgi:hypothetical protein